MIGVNGTTIIIQFWTDQVQRASHVPLTVCGLPSVLIPEGLEVDPGVPNRVVILAHLMAHQAGAVLQRRSVAPVRSSGSSDS